MPGLQCAFCAHLNPQEAKFCNACGSPLSLRPCAQCDAVNEDAATACYKCGASLGDVETEARVASADDRTAEPEPVLALDTAVEHERPAKAGGDIFALFQDASAPQGGRPGPRAGLVHATESAWRDDVFKRLSRNQRSNAPPPPWGKTTLARRRTTLAAALTGLAVVVLAVWANDAYRSPGQATIASEAAATPHSEPAPGTGSVPSEGHSVPVPSSTPGVQPQTTDAATTAKDASAATETPSSSPATSSDTPTHAQDEATPANSRPRNPSIAECTEAVAALGFCNRPSSENR